MEISTDEKFCARQVLIRSFLTGCQRERKPKKQRPEFAPTFSPVLATNHIHAGGNDSVYTGPLQSIASASYHNYNVGAGNCVYGKLL